jgi:glycosyltransferase involved in cell wall biosynthesis
MARWSPVPFVLGPLNGGLEWPKEFAEERKREREWMIRFRSAYRYLPYFESTYRGADAILVSFRHTMEGLPRYARSKAIDFPEIGLDPELFSCAAEEAPPAGSHSAGGRLTFLFAGRFAAVKCIEIAVRAFAESPALRRHRLLLVGDGPDRPMLEEIVREEGVGNCVEFAGWKTQAELGKLLRESDFFVFPSVRELGAGAVLEAMASGLCSIVVDYGGPGWLAGGGRGVRVPMGTREQITVDFRREMEALVDDRPRAASLAAAGRRFALTEMTWAAKARKTLEVYRWVLGRRAERPLFVGDPDGG